MTDFDKFQHEEYKQIAEAHFRTIEAISSFFRYYLIIMSIPLTAAGIFLALMDKGDSKFDDILPYASMVFGIIALIGFLVMLYIINLRSDVIWYARTVNSIRKYFYDRVDMDPINVLRLRVLPQSTSQPSYFEPIYFLPVILAFGLFNSIYAAIPFIKFGGFSGSISDKSISYDNAVELVVFFAGFCFSHFAAYYLYARHREYSDLRTNGVGVDIDGVLNVHRDQFCKVLFEKTKIKIEPEEIETLPVHEGVLNVSREDELAVFNDPTYWSSMPASDDVARSIRKLRNALQVKVHLFTHRPWPDLSSCSHLEEVNLADEWQREAKRLTDRVYHGERMAERIRIFLNQVALWARLMRPISVITKCWLREKDIPYHSLTIERGNENLANPNTRYRNRFNIARRKRLRYFVEDDREKAVKLAYICDVVFLINHPYNQAGTSNSQSHNDPSVIGDLPKNVIRVESWNEIYKWIRRMA